VNDRDDDATLDVQPEASIEEGAEERLQELHRDQPPLSGGIRRLQWEVGGRRLAQATVWRSEGRFPSLSRLHGPAHCHSA